ncbi:MAG: DNA lyase [FCB group bacterium]|nr:DNA lyase [FCB group bacterium]MBL7027228.1 DNA lyase [Candidatus Neomarinimicrobiota bacterium]MBL7120537.1 DNA lyase [Candidatus Neomarinimicrobiota bacterium]
MRIWSLHPMYLDSKGLAALWRETLLAKRVLEGMTKGYQNHPQLHRFKATNHPLNHINSYLLSVLEEAKQRGFHFDESKIGSSVDAKFIAVTTGQLFYEQTHLLGKLRVRDLGKYHKLNETIELQLHPLFNLIEGDVEDWEIR